MANTLRLLGLPEEIKASLAAGEISEGHARALLGLADAGARRRSGSRCESRTLRARDRGAGPRRLREQPAAQSRHRDIRTARVRTRQDPDLAALAERLQGSLGTAVQISAGGGRRGGRW